MIGGREAEDNWKKCHFSPSLPDATGRRQKFFFFLRRKEDYSCTYLMFLLSKEKLKSIQLSLIFFGKGHTFYALINIGP